MTLPKEGSNGEKPGHFSMNKKEGDKGTKTIHEKLKCGARDEAQRERGWPSE